MQSASQHEQAMKPQGWSELILGRMGRIEAMSGRDVLRGTLHALGFKLI